MNRSITSSLAIFVLLMSAPLLADDDDSDDDDSDARLWRNHATPYSFLFGNRLDTHQETRLQKNGVLKGFLYVYWTGDVTDDGEPIAKHCSEQQEPGCFAGWTIEAEPCIEEVNGCRAMFIYHDNDHPLWIVGPESGSGLRGTRSMIPQPGSFTHLHWLTEGSTHNGVFYPSSLSDLEQMFGVNIDLPAACNVATASGLTAGVECPGYFLQLKAIEKFVFEHSGERIPVSPGIDNATHVNIVTSFPAIE